MRIEDLLKVPPLTYIVVLLLAAAILPGFLLIFMFDSNLYCEMELIRLCVLSVTFVLPLLVPNIGAGLWLAFSDKEIDDLSLKWPVGIAFGSGMTVNIITILIVLRVFVKMSVKWAVVITLCLQVLVIIGTILISRDLEHRTNKKSNAK